MLYQLRYLLLLLYLFIYRPAIVKIIRKTDFCTTGAVVRCLTSLSYGLYLKFYIWPISDLFPQLDHQKRVMAKVIKSKKNKDKPAERMQHQGLSSKQKKLLEEKVPKAYRLGKPIESSDESSVNLSSHEEDKDESSEEDSDMEHYSDGDDNALADVKVSTLVNDMEKLREHMIEKNEYQKLKEKIRIYSEN